MLGLHCCTGFSLVVVSELLIALASFLVEHRLYGTQVSMVSAHRL